MPFTLAHPAAVWPLKFLRYLAVIPLVIGSLTPDLASYIPNSHALVNSHTLRGTIRLDLPLGFALLLALFVLRPILLAPLWQPHRQFLRQCIDTYFSNRWWWVIAIPSLLLGSWTHILWDSFTHENHFMVRHLSVLQHAVDFDDEHRVSLFRILQYVCSVLGLVFIGWWYTTALRSSRLLNEKESTSYSKRIIIGLVIASLVAGLINAVVIPPEWRSMYSFISTVLVTAMPVFVVSYLLFGYWQWLRQRKNPLPT